MIDALSLTLGALFLLLSRLGQIPSESLLVWKMNIFVSEYGQWVAIASALLILLPWLLGYRLRWRLLSIILFTAATAGLLEPTWTMRARLPEWTKNLEAQFGVSGLTPPDWWSVWTARAPKPVAAQTFEYVKGLDLRSYRAGSRAPWVIIVHGGGWNSGDADQLPELNSALVEAGIAFFSSNYRLAPASTWPAPREDVEHAVEFIKAHAAQFDVDPSRWAILGRSAGGQIAACAGYAANDPALKGVIAFYSPTDMNFAYKYGREDDILNSRSLVRDYLGGDPEHVPANYTSASPMDLARKSSPPTLMFHGPRDPLVWVRHSRRLNDRLGELGAKSLLIELPWVTHAFDYNLYGPGGRVSTYAVLHFLKRVF